MDVGRSNEKKKMTADSETDKETADQHADFRLHRVVVSLCATMLRCAGAAWED